MALPLEAGPFFASQKFLEVLRFRGTTRRHPCSQTRVRGRDVSREQEYLRNAKDAQEWADRAVTAEDRAGWLRIAQGWLYLFTRWTHSAELRKSRTDAVNSDQDV